MIMVPEGLGELGSEQGILKDAIDQAEKFVGDSGEAEAVKQFGNKPLPETSPLVQFVQAVGNDLVPQVRSSRRDFGYKFGVLDSPIVNAFALPNGSIYVTTGLLHRLRSEDELAALMGHEIAHVTEHHGLQSISLGVTSLQFLRMAGRLFKGTLNEDDTEVGTALVHSLINNGYSREQETDSDRMGHFVSYRSGYDPNGMVGLHEQFLALEETEPSSVEKMFQSHPWSGDRVASAKSRITEMRFQPVHAVKSPKLMSFSNVSSQAAAYDKESDLTVPLALFGTSVGILALVMYLR